MVVITREQAICIFYCEPYNKTNVEKFSKIIDDLENVEICYYEDPTKPALQCARTIYSHPFEIHTYKTEKEITSEIKKEQEVQEKPKINNIPQLVQFLNIVYVPNDPINDCTYESKFVEMTDILAKVWKYSYLFDEANPGSFNKWCNDKKLSFLNSAVKRRKNTMDKRVSVRSVFVLKEEFIGDVIDNIINYLPKYQHYIERLKKEGHLIVGYARKSKQQNDNLDGRVRLLQIMVERLQERSLVEKVFVSVNCNSNHPLVERDTYQNDTIKKLKNVDGDMQDLLKLIAIKPKICLVVVDSAGLTTNVNDLKIFMKNNVSIKKIIVDNLSHTNKISVLERDEILQDHEKLKIFNGRDKLYQRSK